MTDLALRVAEREAHSGGTVAETKLLSARLRAGRLAEEDVILASRLGHEAARLVVSLEAAASFDGLLFGWATSLRTPIKVLGELADRRPRVVATWFSAAIEHAIPHVASVRYAPWRREEPAFENPNEELFGRHLAKGGLELDADSVLMTRNLACHWNELTGWLKYGPLMWCAGRSRCCTFSVTGPLEKAMRDVARHQAECGMAIQAARMLQRSDAPVGGDFGSPHVLRRGHRQNLRNLVHSLRAHDQRPTTDAWQKNKLAELLLESDI